ncbi:hypothetical protein C8Q75DRAFT_389262 [Abortiporus biennis]|nr:hypothetical protein C8Q75DRAFT_389262 [Abortiporus biennis]
MLPTLPLEIWTYVLMKHDISRADLRNISLVCHTFREISIRTLLHHVHSPSRQHLNADQRAIQDAITRLSSRAFKSNVVSISLHGISMRYGGRKPPFPTQLTSRIENLHSALFLALGEMPRLKSLDLYKMYISHEHLAHLVKITDLKLTLRRCHASNVHPSSENNVAPSMLLHTLTVEDSFSNLADPSHSEGRYTWWWRPFTSPLTLTVLQIQGVVSHTFVKYVSHYKIPSLRSLAIWSPLLGMPESRRLCLGCPNVENLEIYHFSKFAGPFANTWEPMPDSRSWDHIDLYQYPIHAEALFPQLALYKGPIEGLIQFIEGRPTVRDVEIITQITEKSSTPYTSDPPSFTLFLPRFAEACPRLENLKVTFIQIPSGDFFGELFTRFNALKKLTMVLYSFDYPTMKTVCTNISTVTFPISFEYLYVGRDGDLDARKHFPSAVSAIQSRNPYIKVINIFGQSEFL